MTDYDYRNDADQGAYQNDADEGTEGDANVGEELSNYDIDPPSIGCFYRFRQELKCAYGFFSLDEHDGTVLCVKNTFAPDPIAWTILARIILSCLTIAAMTYSIINYPSENRWIWMGFLTHWTVVLTIAYFAIALAVSLSPWAVEQPRHGEPPNILVRFAWAFYSLVLPMNIVVVLLYWALDYEPGETTITFVVLALHAGTCLLVLIDGNLISTIPIRLKHIVFVESMAVLLVIWTVINDLTGIGDGKWPGEDADQNNADDALYSVLNWSDNPTRAAIISVIVIFVVIPVVFLLCWMLSLWSCCLKCDGSRRQTYQEDGDGKAGSYEGEEEGEYDGDMRAVASWKTRNN